MRDEARHEASQALLTLADLTPSATAATDARGVIPLEWFRWLPLSAQSLLVAEETGPPAPLPTGLAPQRAFVEGLDQRTERPRVTIERDLGEQLAVIDQLRVGEHTLRVGWLFVAGRVKDADGRTARVFQPLLTRPMRIVPDPDRRRSVVQPAGDVAAHPAIGRGPARDRFETEVHTGGEDLASRDEVAIAPAVLASMTTLTGYAQRLATAAGFAVSGCVAAGEGPEALMRRDDLVVVVGSAIYAARPTSGTTTAA